MTPSRTELLKKIHKHSLEYNEPLSIHLENEDGECIENVRQLMNDVDWLTQEGYISQPFSACGYLSLALREKGEDFLLGKPDSAPNTVSFHFDGATIQNSVIGTNNIDAISFNGTETLDQIWKIIQTKSEDDRALLEEMLEVLREIQRTGKPCKETGLARFYELVKKTEDLTLPLLKFFFGIFS